MWLLRSLLIVSMALLPTGSLRADTFQVTKTADTNDGTCDADCSLREAIVAANTNPGGDDVPVPAGNYLLTLGQLSVSEDVDISGAGESNTIIDGNDTDRVFLISSATTVTINTLTIQNGNDFYDGGGIINYGTLTLNDTTVSGNYARVRGGGVFNHSGTLTLNNTTVSGNQGRRGGGGVFNRSGTLTLNNATVSGNSAFSYGGGVANDFRGGAVTLNNTTISGNSSAADGGGLFVSYNTLTLNNSTVIGNSAGFFGGGVANDSGTVTLNNTTVSGNSAGYSGGGVFFYRYIFGGVLNDFYVGTVTLNNTTFSGNSAGNSGASIWSNILNVYVENSIIANALSSPHCFGTSIVSLGHNLADDTSCGFSATGDLVVADAMLGPLQDNGGPTETHTLLAGSPAIDAASLDCPPPTTDQRGVLRPQAAACDIGAFEVEAAQIPALTPFGRAAFVILLFAAMLVALRVRRREPRSE